MDMADLTADPLFAGPDLFIQDNAAADAGSQSYHDKVFVAFSASLPHLTESRDVRVISAFYDHTIQQSAELLLWISGLPAEVYTHFAVSVRKNRSRESHSRSGKIRELQTAFLCHSTDRSRNIAQDILSVLLFSCRNLPLLYESSVFLKDTELHACSADIDSNTL